jgi:hypothetical protein
MSYAQTARLCLSSWITHLLTAVPPRSRATFVELLCGCLISPEGWVYAVTGRRCIFPDNFSAYFSPDYDTGEQVWKPIIA